MITREEKMNQDPFSRLKSKARIFIKERPRKILSHLLLFILKRKFDKSNS
jgi:hypothetical protein